MKYIGNRQTVATYTFTLTGSLHKDYQEKIKQQRPFKN